MTYQGKKKLMRPDEYEVARAKLMEDKQGAVSTAVTELEGIINVSQFAKQYFNKSQSWLSQKIHGCVTHNKVQSFSAAEYQQFSDSFRDLARRLNTLADEIDAAKIPET